MPYRVFFTLSTGLAKPVKVPKGTLDDLKKHIERTEQIIGLQREPADPKYGRPETWKCGEKDFAAIMEGRDYNREWTAKISRIEGAIQSWNDRVERFYDLLGQCSEPDGGKKGGYAKKSETITPKQMAPLWGFLRHIQWPREYWSRDWWVAHMEHLYDVLSGRESRGVTIECEPLTPDQVQAIVTLMECEMDQWNYDARLYDAYNDDNERVGFLTSSYDGGHDWCDGCGKPYQSEYTRRVCANCPKGKECDLREIFYDDEFEEEDAEREREKTDDDDQ